MSRPDPGSMPRGLRRFVALWLQDVSDEFHHRGFYALVPTTLAPCVAAGVALGYFAKPQLWTELQNALALYAALLAVNAILLAVCWAAFARILDAMNEGEFGEWFRIRKLNVVYGFYIDFTNATQSVAVFASACGLLVSVLPVPEIVNRIALGIAVGASAYAGRWAAGVVRIMQDLADKKTEFRTSADTTVKQLNSGK